MKVLHWGMLVTALALGVFAWAKWGAVEDFADGHAEGRRRDEQLRVRFKAEVDPTCPKESPIRLTVANGNDRALTSVDFHVGIYEEGQSEDVASAEPDEHWSAAIAAFGSQSRCRAWPAGLPKKAARYYFRADKHGAAMFSSANEPPPP